MKQVSFKCKNLEKIERINLRDNSGPRVSFRLKHSMNFKIIFEVSATQSMSNSNCFSYFNPGNSNEYDWYVKNWSAAINDMLHDMIEEEKHEPFN